MKLTYLLLAAILLSTTAFAQEKTDKLVISGDGISIEKGTDKDGNGGKKAEDKKFSLEVAMIDIGINSLNDKTDYTTAAARNFLQVPATIQNDNLFSMRTGKSINVNIAPVMGKWRVLKTKGQKIYLGLGVGLQMYNFRFNKNISYVNNSNPAVILEDSIGFTKNKLGLTYLTVPLMATFKTKLADKAWLVYGVGVSAGYRIDSWTKQISSARGKDKNHDAFNLNDFNTCISGEIGLDDYFRVFASYQLTALHTNALDQHPFSIGIRFGGL
ncbi:MAG: hypothetical protein EOP51_02915 [Sphingobacteriales bacterium]|nr:MAG: hypothetical protein EOP51_02915 [Sphingobacteriales bacterium]